MTRPVALATAALLACAGCTVGATGVVVTVEGAGVTADQLSVVATADGAALPPQLVPAQPATLTLPATFFAELPDGTHTASFAVTALAAGVVVASGSSPDVALAAHRQAAVTVELAPAPFCGPTATPAACAGGAFVLCDGFEAESGTAFTEWSNSAVANAGGGPANAGTTLAVASAPVCAGTHALHAVAAGSAQQAFVYKEGLALPSTSYLRAFLYLPSPASSASFDLFSFATADISKYLQLGYDAGTGKLFFFRNFDSELDFPTTLPLDRWICLEATIGFDAAAGSVALALDGVPLGSQPAGVTQPAGASYTTFDAGLVFATSSADVYLDEIVLSSSPIGCR